MSLKANVFFSSLIAVVLFLAMFFFIVPWLLLILAVVGIAAFVSVLLGRGSINITTIRITNTPHDHLVQDIKTVSSTVALETGRDRKLQEQIPDTDITIYPGCLISETVPKENSFETTKEA